MTAHESQRGGWVINNCTSLPVTSVYSSVSATLVKFPNKPEEMLFINENKLMSDPHLVEKMTLMICPKASGIKKIPRMAPLATTRHFNRAEIACDKSDNSKIQTTLQIRIELAIQRFSLNQVKPSR